MGSTVDWTTSVYSLVREAALTVARDKILLLLNIVNLALEATLPLYFIIAIIVLWSDYFDPAMTADLWDIWSKQRHIFARILPQYYSKYFDDSTTQQISKYR